MKGFATFLVAVFTLAVSVSLGFAEGEEAAPVEEDLSRPEARQEAREGKQDARQDAREGKQDARYAMIEKDFSPRPECFQGVTANSFK